MPIDARLREGLERSMSAIEADAERYLPDVRSRARRRRVVHRAATVVAVAAAVVIVAVAAPKLLDVLRNDHRQPATNPSSAPIEGTYVTKITPREAGRIGVPEAAGNWLLTLRGDGVLQLASLRNADLGRATTQYQLSGTEIITSALAGSGCTGLGRYDWSHTGSSLTFVLVSDPCPLRVAIFSSHVWSSR